MTTPALGEEAPSTAVTNSTQDQVPEYPDYTTDPDAVLKDPNVTWRYGRAPDYSKTRKYFAETKTTSHPPLSLPSLVQNLVKNWEIEASFKPNLHEWRTIDPSNYSFAVCASLPIDGPTMLRLGSYNALIPPNPYYDPARSDFASSHKTFKRMMPSFAWEVLEVYSGPPVVAFRWRHWGVMKGNYVGVNDRGERISVKAHGGMIELQGVTVASVGEGLRLKEIRTWFDAMDMFREIAREGQVRSEVVVGAGKSPAEVVQEGQGGEKVSKEQTLPDATVQTAGEVDEMLREGDETRKSGSSGTGEKSAVGKEEGGSRMPESHTKSVSGTSWMCICPFARK